MDYNLNDIIDLLDILRGENGCAWDKQQTFASLKNYLLEEAYEVAEAIDEQDNPALKEELGDLLFHIMFHIHMAEEERIFTFDEIKQSILDKMKGRHPHIFGDISTNDTKVILKNWERIKKETRRVERSSAVDGVPREFPTMLRARRICEKAANVGFEWPSEKEFMQKIDEELLELCNAKTHDEREDEMGDLLFALINLSRFYDVDPEKALKRTTSKFIDRFKSLEERTNHHLDGHTLDELIDFWKESKGKA
jgi:tetrapyrrole methylase family protein / MazG family protein